MTEGNRVRQDDILNLLRKEWHLVGGELQISRNCARQQTALLLLPPVERHVKKYCFTKMQD